MSVLMLSLIFIVLIFKEAVFLQQRLVIVFTTFVVADNSNGSSLMLEKGYLALSCDPSQNILSLLHRLNNTLA